MRSNKPSVPVDVREEAKKAGLKLVNGSGRKPIAEGVERYFAPKDVNDVDVYDLIVRCFKVAAMPEAIKAFTSDPSIIAIKDKSSDVQRCIINRHFRLISLRYVSRSGNSVLPIFLEFFNDGDVMSWLERIYSPVCGFFKHNRVYETLA